MLSTDPWNCSITA